MKSLRISILLLVFLWSSLALAIDPGAVRSNNAAADHLKTLLKELAQKQKDAQRQRQMQQMGQKMPQQQDHSQDSEEEPGALSALWDIANTLKSWVGLSAEEGSESEVKVSSSGDMTKASQGSGEDEEVSVDVYPAYSSLVEGLGKAPFQPELHLNLGLAFELNKELDKAAKSYKAAGQFAGENATIKFLSHYNSARIAAAQKNIDLALSHYQQALEIMPDSKEVKTNIEFLWQQSQQQGGGGKEKDDKQEGGKGKDKKKDPKDDEQKDQDDPNKKMVNRRKQQPKPFDSKKLTKDDVRKILEEIKNQEQKIRAKAYRKKIKEKPRGKDW